ncbi:hypothetical protein ABW21_db0204406 [Orbilia brochopaga]|nr:hypothetical protein ABW21_db0204406 [Drechslerella brochopaga]
MPWKWVRPFWLTLMRTKGVRFGGLLELEQLTLEGKFGSYPTDFPATQAGRMEAVRHHQDFLERIKRRSATKVRGTAKKDARVSPDGVEAEYGYPWDRVFRAVTAESRSVAQCRPEPWQLPPSLTRSLQSTPQDALPPSISEAVFTVHIRLFGRGAVTAGAWVYSLPRRGTEVFQQLKLQYARDGRSSARILDEVQLDPENGATRSGPSTEAAQGEWDSPIGFVIRGSFGYSEGMPVAVAVLAWARALEGGRQGPDRSSGWCVLRKAEGGIGRLAQWEAV